MKWIKKAIHDKMIDMAMYYFLRVLGSKECRQKFINQMRMSGSIPNLENDQFDIVIKKILDILTMLVISYEKDR